MVPKPVCSDEQQRTRVLEERIEALEKTNSKLREENLLLKTRIESSPDGILVIDGKKR